MAFLWLNLLYQIELELIIIWQLNLFTEENTDNKAELRTPANHHVNLRAYT